MQEFQRLHGRAPRVLHVGNIANNAYCNARHLREAGIDCDVIAYDYYHIMGCPEWEDADFVGDVGDHFFPDWSAVNLRGFQRPYWFAQASLRLCHKYLLARRQGRKGAARFWWKMMQIETSLLVRSRKPGLIQTLWPLQKRTRQLARDARALLGVGQRAPGVSLGSYLVQFPATVARNLLSRIIARVPGERSPRLRERLRRRIRVTIARSREEGHTRARLLLFFPAVLLGAPINLLQKFLNWLDGPLGPRGRASGPFDFRVHELVAAFNEAFPHRQDKLTEEDLEPYRYVAGSWAKLFREYDLVQAYATDPILPMLAGHCPYVAFEHGTLREFTLRDNPLCRATSLGYRLADHVFITNGDCLEYARAIGVERYSPMLHPVDETRVRNFTGNYEQLHARFGVSKIFFCPARHDWAIKGTDMYIRALPDIAREIGRDFRLIMIPWGKQVDDSRALAEQLGVADLIEWVDPLSHVNLYRMLKSVDVLFDQMILPCFGAITPEGIAAGLPVVMSYRPESMEWILPEPAPILSAFRVEDIVEAVKIAVDDEWQRDYQERARRWVDESHSSAVVVREHLEVYGRLLMPGLELGQPSGTAARGSFTDTERAELSTLPVAAAFAAGPG